LQAADLKSHIDWTRESWTSTMMPLKYTHVTNAMALVHN